MILFSIAFALTLTASCRSAEASAVGINEAIELTLTNNSGLRSLRQETIKAFAFQIQADGTLLPSLSANAYLDRQKESTTNDEERNDNKGARATLEQVIY